MDLYVEKQCVDQMKTSDSKKFLMLFDVYFQNVYKYVARRVNDLQEIERITKLTFLDAVGQIQSTPSDIMYTVWLYNLAKPRVASYINRAVFPKKQGLISSEDYHSRTPEFSEEGVVEKASNMFKKLTMEEAEILRLKFFEELADGDVQFIIGGEDALIGPKIYRVLKRAHFLLFGESDQKQGIYFGELSGFLERTKESQKIEVPEAFRLSLRAELSNKLDNKEFAVNVPVFETENYSEVETSTPWKEIEKKEGGGTAHVGSNDPAKIFVEAVREMRQEEEQRRVSEMEDADKTERILEIFDKAKGMLIVIPVAIFVLVGFFIVKTLWFEGKIDRGITGVCPFDTQFDGDFEDSEMLSIDSNVSKTICREFKPKSLVVTKIEDNSIKVNVDVNDGILLYDFVWKDGVWKIKSYAKTSYSDTESGKVQRNI
jgi:RNA polymerase sigma-70 factor (ECF subfamily)